MCLPIVSYFLPLHVSINLWPSSVGSHQKVNLKSTIFFFVNITMKLPEIKTHQNEWTRNFDHTRYWVQDKTIKTVMTNIGNGCVSNLSNIRILQILLNTTLILLNVIRCCKHTNVNFVQCGANTITSTSWWKEWIRVWAMALSLR